MTAKNLYKIVFVFIFISCDKKERTNIYTYYVDYIHKSEPDSTIVENVLKKDVFFSSYIFNKEDPYHYESVKEESAQGEIHTFYDFSLFKEQKENKNNFKIEIVQKKEDSLCLILAINIVKYEGGQWQPRLKAGDFTIARDTLTDAELADRIKNLIVGLTFK